MRRARSEPGKAADLPWHEADDRDPWIHAIPEKYIPGQIIKGKIAKLTNFGAFVELEPELEGLLHISELADHKIDKPQDVVKPRR